MSYSHLFAKDFESNIKAMVRVDFAGEMGAVEIYNAQIKNSREDNPENKELLEEMLDGEIEHFEFFKKISKEMSIPQTVFLPLWKRLASVMGGVTAKRSPSLAMLCTHAVETVIEEHYAQQISQLEDILTHHNEQDSFVLENKEKIEELLEKIKIFMQEEIQHKETGETHSQMQLLPFLIMKAFTKTAVIISEKI
jgi:ubiquinone biosynthesis monooxygenase Coq7